MTDAPQNRFYKTSSPMLVSEGSSRLYSIDQGCSSIDENEMADPSLVGRRSALIKSASLFGTVAAALTCQSEQVWAATASTQADKDKIVKGYNRLTYLLDNWEKETTICGRTDNPYIGCERTPEKVMEVCQGRNILNKERFLHLKISLYFVVHYGAYSTHVIFILFSCSLSKCLAMIISIWATKV
jgi:hypothetical protein